MVVRLVRSLSAALVVAGGVVAYAAPASAQTSRCGPAITVAFGDTLFRIAERCGTTVRAIMDANPQLINQYFIIPGMRIAMPAPPPTPGGSVVRYTVRPGDTLLTIARMHNVTLPDIYRLNPDIDAASLRPGDIIRLPGGIVPPRPLPTPPGGDRYTVRPGDTLFSIARFHDTTIAEIRRLNPGIDMRPLRVGDIVRVPGRGVTPPPALPPVNTVTYTVRPGDTIYSIARAHGMTASQILKLNPRLDPSRLRAGDTIRLRGGIVPPPPPPPSGVSAAVSPASGAPGANVQISASGFRPNTNLKLLSGSSAGALQEFQQVTTDGRGNVTFTARVPAWAADRGTLVFAFETLDGRLRAVTGVFRVTSAPTPPAPPRDLQVTGTLTREGAECPALRGDDGRLYTLAQLDLGRFRPGDRVSVEGRVAEMSTCMQGTTIDVRSIRPAQ